MSTSQRKILPASDKAEQVEYQPSKKRRTSVRVACNNCRSKRTSCDGNRPSCARCETQKIECVYISNNAEETTTMALKSQIERLQKDLKEHTEVIDHIRSVSQPEAWMLLHKIRSTPNVSNVLSTIKGAVNSVARPSDQETARAILPPTESNLQFELNILHPSVYAVLTPLDFDNLDMPHLFSKGPRSSPSMIGDGAIDTSAINSPPSPLRGTSSGRDSPSAGSIQDRDFCDARLKLLKVDFWTAIPISDDFAACVLSYHFEHYHAVFGCVDSDLFISDLVNQKNNYCSPILFYAIMSLACQSYSAVDSRSSAFGVAFIRGVEKLWEAEKVSDSPKNLAALCYMTMTGTVYGDEQLRSRSLRDARAMATRMSLMDTQPREDLLAAFHQLPADKVKELAHVAWGAYGAFSYFGIFYMDPPISLPPMLPIPGGSGTVIGSSKLDWPAHPLPAYMGRTFSTLSSFWVLVQEINMIYIPSANASLVDTIPLAFAELKCQELLAWANNFSSDMLPEKNSKTHVFFLYGIYHCTMLSLFRPFQDSKEKVRLASFSSLDATPATLCSASLNQIKRLLATYCTTSPPFPIVVWFNGTVLEIGNAITQNPLSEPNWRFYLNACMEFWRRAYVSYRVIYIVARAYLLVAIKMGAIEYDTADRMLKELRESAPHHDTPESAVSSAILDFGIALAKKEQDNIDSLAKEFDELVLFHRFTYVEDD